MDPPSINGVHLALCCMTLNNINRFLRKQFYRTRLEMKPLRLEMRFLKAERFERYDVIDGQTMTP
jgi:hypothetical protein